MSRVSATLHQIAQNWPADPLRPTMQFSQVLSSLSTSPNLSVRAVMAARALSENRLKTQFPLSEKTTTPASTPLHYTRLVEGVEKAIRGEKRSFIERFFSL
ncbi:hypothetical protein DL93DRAFT_2167662 [Clavulina sp. PMI_390]|nr:hypothetical protein DL93DRAFT_2167662 [Clavulina sp. PMI_390]